MGLTEKLKQEAISLSQKAVEKLLSDEKRAMRIAEAIGKVQRGREALRSGQDELMRQLNFAPKSDFRALGKQLSALKRRVRELDQRLGQLI